MKSRTTYQNIVIFIILVLALMLGAQAAGAATVAKSSTGAATEQNSAASETEPAQAPAPSQNTSDTLADGEDKTGDTSDTTGVMKPTTVATETDPNLIKETNAGESVASETGGDNATATEAIREQPGPLLRTAPMTVRAQPWNATISASSLRLRLTPDQQYTSINTYSRGVRLQVLGYVDGQEVLAGNNCWYRVIMEPTGAEGYMYAAYIALDPGVVVDRYVEQVQIDPNNPPLTDQEFQVFLDNEFPASYHAGLKDLHRKYPYWTFSAKNINHDWDYVVTKQSPGKTSTVPIGRITSMKSYAADSYDYRTDSWKALDAGFTGASPEAVKYYLDPRNFLDQTGIFQFEQLSYNANYHTLAGIEKMLKGTFMDPAGNSEHVNAQGKIVYLNAAGQKVTLNKTYAQVFMDAATASGASPYFLVSRVIQEVGRAGSASVKGTFAAYPGIYNYYNIGATASTNPIANGLKYASGGTTYQRPWTDPEKAIKGGAEWIAKLYINKGQDSLYLQKYDFVEFWHQYMSNVMAPPSEAAIVMRNYLEMGIIQQPLHFVIPVMRNMPQTPQAKPTDNLSRNNWLSGISAPAALTPAFNPEVYNYTLTLNEAVNQILLTGTPYHAQADIITEVNGKAHQGAIPVPASASAPLVVKLIVRAEKRDVQRTYTITVKHKGSGTNQAPLLQTTVYNIEDGVLSGLNPKKNQHLAENILRDLKLSDPGYTMQIRNKAGEIVTTGVVSTGCTLEVIKTGQTVPEFVLPFIMYGDINGNGYINIVDMTFVMEHFFQRNILSGPELQAADVNNNGVINVVDATFIAEYFFGRIEITNNR
ncbi:MAG: dockerin type I domain-containing protein [Saccharofermentanales bacterium]|jgi:beta-N-acetylglucosaminidase|nr:dockerin type I domain-containing protein [Bacillota bacterium]